jgi:hypothetical protein
MTRFETFAERALVTLCLVGFGSCVSTCSAASVWLWSQVL